MPYKKYFLPRDLGKSHLEAVNDLVREEYKFSIAKIEEVMGGVIYTMAKSISQENQKTLGLLEW